MNDLIRRQDAINEAIKDGAYGYISVEELKRLPSAEPKWIPTSERLPRLDENVLITVRGTVTIAMYFNYDVDFEDLAHWVSNDLEEDIELNDVTAWMPLPKPYAHDER